MEGTKARVLTCFRYLIVIFIVGILGISKATISLAATTIDKQHVQIGVIAEVLVDHDDDGELDKLGQTVTVTGRANIASAVLHHEYLSVFIQDENAGILVYSDTLAQQVQIGDSLVVTGELKKYYGKPEVVVDHLKVIKGEHKPIRIIPLSQTYDKPDKYQGMLVEGEVNVLSKSYLEAGAFRMRISPIAKPDRILYVYISEAQMKTQRFNFDFMEIGDKISVRGVFDQYTFKINHETVRQIVPRYPADIDYVGIPRQALTFLFWGGGIVIVLFLSWNIVLKRRVKAKTEEISRALNEKTILLHEVHHRVKNNLAIVSGFLQLESMNWDENPEVKHVLNESILRIKSIALIHEQLYQSNDFSNLYLGNYIEKLTGEVIKTMAPANKDISLDIESDDIRVNINQAIPCALIVNELVANAYEHGFNNLDSGKVQVKMTQNGDFIHLDIKDNGVGFPKNFDIDKSDTLGLFLVKQLTDQLKGKLKFKNGEGSCFQLKFRKVLQSGSASHFL